MDTLRGTDDGARSGVSTNQMFSGSGGSGFVLRFGGGFAFHRSR